MPKKRFTVIDLFSGAGGMTLGFKKAGFKPIAASEHESSFADTYEANFGTHVYRGDIQNEITDLKKLRAVNASVKVQRVPG